MSLFSELSELQQKAKMSEGIHIELFHGLVADSYHLLISCGQNKVVVTIEKIQAVEVSQKLNMPIKDY